MNHIYNKYYEARQKDIASYIEENIVDGDIPDKDGKQYVFLATNGSWQTKYLSLYEMLHDKYIAKYCAKLLLDDYLEKHSLIVNRILTSGATQAEIDAELYKQVAFTKIVTVTVSSQLIGVALRNLIRDDVENKYRFLRDPEEPNRLKSCPELLRLSSYYSFDEEKPFKDISDKDRVIVVNDVISTGNLIYKISRKVKNKKAKLKAVFSIADTRVTKPNLLVSLNLEVKNGQETAIESNYIYGSDDEEGLFFTLVKCNEKEHALRKYQRPYKGTAEVKRINPLLNTIVELETKHSEEKRVLFRKPENLINSAIVDESHFKVGHFRQNLSHNGYLTDMHNLFSPDGDNSPGDKLLGAIKLRLDEFLNEQKPSTTIIDSILHNIELLLKASSNNAKLSNAFKELSEFAEVYAEENLSTIVSFKPDYIFYPPFSGIEQLSESILNKYFGTSIENIICLQRFDTNKGWRFPFPAKWYNHLTKDKSVLILDSGSLTGESLVQLVDSISFLDVKEITVLCAITRIEDFYREFYSRLKFSKVKILQASDTTTEEEKSKQRQHIVPLNIIFGTNLNIPVFPSKISCPFCEEIRLLKYYQDKARRFQPSEWTNNYIKLRQEEIIETNLEKLEKYNIPYYFPKVKNSEPASISSIDIFLMRDRIGKVDSYRFYKDYFFFFDELKNNVDKNGLYDEANLKQLELMLITILHEPNILRTINDLLIDIKDYCQKLIEDSFFNSKESSADAKEFFYEWPKYSILRLAVIFFPNRFNEIKTWDRAFEFSLSDERGLNYLSFLLWEAFLGESQLISNQEYVNLISLYSDKLDGEVESKGEIFQDKRIRKIIKGITNKLVFSSITSLNDAYFNLRKFFFGQTSSNTHNEFIRHFSLFKNKIENIDKSKEDIPLIIGYIEHISNFLQDGILNNLLYIRNDAGIKKCHELNYSTLFNPKGVFEDLSNLIKQFDDIIERKGEIISSEDYATISNSYTALDKLYIKHIIEGSTFYSYCHGYKASFIKCLLETLSDDSKIQNKLNGIKKLKVCDVEILFTDTFWKDELSRKILDRMNPGNNEPVYLSIHETFLMHGIEEIIINSIKHTSNHTVVIDIQVVKNESETLLKFIHSGQGEMEIVPETVKLIFESFCGNSNVKFYNDEDGNYNIEILFNTESLKLI